LRGIKNALEVHFVNSFNCVCMVSILPGNISKTGAILEDSHDLVG
jgi:hypothetical protein